MLAACAAPALAAFAVCATPAFADAATYSWIPSASTILVRTDRGGLFGRMGHRHDIRAQSFTGTIELDPAAIAATRIDLVISAASLKVVDHDLDASDVEKVQRDMETKVLEVEKHPEIRFTSTEASPRDGGESGGTGLIMRGTLALHGVTKPLSTPVVVTIEADGRVRLKGSAIVKQTDFEIEPISVGLGAVTVKNEVKIELDLFAEAGVTSEAPPPEGEAAPPADTTPELESATSPDSSAASPDSSEAPSDSMEAESGLGAGEG